MHSVASVSHKRAGRAGESPARVHRTRGYDRCSCGRAGRITTASDASDAPTLRERPVELPARVARSALLGDRSANFATAFRVHQPGGPPSRNATASAMPKGQCNRGRRGRFIEVQTIAARDAVRDPGPPSSPPPLFLSIESLMRSNFLFHFYFLLFCFNFCFFVFLFFFFIFLFFSSYSFLRRINASTRTAFGIV